MEDYTPDPQVEDGAPDVITPQTWDEAVVQQEGLTQVGTGLSAVGKPLQSTNYVKGSAGWRINSNGDAEFNSTTIRGVANYVSLPTHQPINGTATPVPITLHSSGYVLIGDANDTDVDDFFGFVNKDYSSQTPAVYNSSTDGGSSTTFSHTLPAGKDRCIIYVYAARNAVGNPTAPSGVTFDGNAFTLVRTTSGDRWTISVWRYVAGTATSATTANIVVTGASSTVSEKHSAHNYVYVDQTTPVASSNGTTSTGVSSLGTSLTPTHTYALVLTVAGYADGSGSQDITNPTGHTDRLSYTNSDIRISDGYYTGASSKTTTATFTFAANESAIVSISFNNSVSTTIDVAVVGMLDGFAGLTIGSDYYLSNTAGAISTTPGATSVLLGKAYSTTTLFIINT